MNNSDKTSIIATDNLIIINKKTICMFVCMFAIIMIFIYSLWKTTKRTLTTLSFDTAGRATLH